MIRLIATLVAAAIGFLVLAPASAQSDTAAPVVVSVAPDGTITVAPPAGTAVPPLTSNATAGLLWGSGSSGASWSELWGTAGFGPSERQLAGRLFSEAAPKGNAQGETSVVVANPRRNYFASCIGCSAAQGSSGEQNRSSASYAAPGAAYAASPAAGGNTSYSLPQDFVQPYALSKPRFMTFAEAAASPNLDFPKRFGLKPPESSETKALAGSSKDSEKKHSDAALTSAPALASAPVEAASRTEEKLSKVVDASTVVTAPSKPEKKLSKLADATPLVAAPNASESKQAALSGPSIGSSVGSARGIAGQAPEPEMWLLTLLGVLGAPLLRRRRR